MTVEAKIIQDSITEYGKRLTTYQLKYPRFIHAELMTHRQFSRNASSSRAIPVKRQIEEILRDTAIPMHWGKNQKGMQADEECNASIDIKQYSMIKGQREEPPYSRILTDRYGAWIHARDKAIEVAEAYDTAGYHKQIVNRLLEPFSHINVVVSATEYSNFFALRIHKDAMPEIQMLASNMKRLMDTNTPLRLEKGEWHLPYVVKDSSTLINMIKQSCARCARVSYVTHEMKEPSLEEDLALYTKLVGGQPIHASPCEHQATPDALVNGVYLNPHKHGNLIGYLQYRKLLDGECQ